MGKSCFFFLFVIFVFRLTTGAQGLASPNIINLNPAEKSQAWLTYSTKVFNHIIEQGFYDSFDSVHVITKIGLELTAKNDYKKLSEYYYFIGHTYKVQLRDDSAFYYLKKGISYAEISRNSYYETLAIQQINYLYRYLGKYEETKPYVARLQKLLPQIKNDEVKDRILSALSEDYLSNGYYNKAIAHIVASLPLKEKILSIKKDYASKVSIGLAYVSLGNLYLELHQNNNALSNFELAKPYFSNYIGGKVRLFANFQQAYLNLEMVDSAMVYYKKVYQCMENYQLYYSSADLSMVNRILASYYLTKNISLAKKYCNVAYQLAVKSENKEEMLQIINLMGSLSYELKDYQKAVGFFEKVLPNSYSFSKDVFADLNLKLAESYEKLDNYQKAIKYYKIYNQLVSEISQQKSDEEISKVEFKYRTLQKEKRIGDLSRQALTANNLLEQQRQLQVALFIAIALAISIAILIFINYQNKNKANLLLQNANDELDILNRRLSEANQSKIKLFSIISHDLRRPVSQLFSFLRLQQNKPNFINHHDYEKHQVSLIKSSTNLLDTLEDLLLWSKSQMENFNIENEKIDIPYFISSIINFFQAQADSKNIRFTVRETSLLALNSDYNLLLIILRNIIQNAIIHSFDDTEIVIELGSNSEQQYISVINHGEVIPPSQIENLYSIMPVKSKSSGYGFLLIKELTEKLDATLCITSDEEYGTAVKVSFRQ